MSRLFYHVMQDNAGNLLFDVTGTMRLAGSGTLATIYGDEALTVILPNPMTNHPSYGSFKCFLGAGDYDFYMAKSGYTFETLTGVQGHGTMAQQDAHAVAITGGTITLAASTGPGAINVANVATAGVVAVRSGVAAGTDKWNLFCEGTAPNYLQGGLGVRATPLANTALYLALAGGVYGLVTIATDQPNAIPLEFRNQALAAVGSITSSATTVAYNTTSDARLKHAITTLVGELAVIRALRPVRFRWLADDSEGVGFLAQEVAEHVQGVVTGDADGVEEDGSIRPQQIDLSKLVPWLVGAVQTLAGQVETLTERVTELEAGT